LILGQGGAVLAAAGQRQHTPAVRLLAPGVHGQQPGRAFHRFLALAALQQQLGQLVQRAQRQVAQPHPLHQRPVLEVGRVAHVEAVQKVALIVAQRLAQQPGARAGRLAAAEAQQLAEGAGVQQVGRVAIEGHRVAGDQQVGIEQLAQVAEHLAQVVGRGRVGHFAPQQAGQRLALVRPAADGQVGQQRRRFTGHKVADDDAVLPDLHAAQQKNFQICRQVRLQQMISK